MFKSLFNRKKKLTKEEKRVKNEISLKTQIKNFELYKKYIEPIFSKLIDLFKNICIFIFAINGTALLAVVNLNNPILNKTIPFLFMGLYFLFSYILILFGYIFIFLYFFKSNKTDYFFISLERSFLFGITFLTFLIVLIEFLLFLFGTGWYLFQYYKQLVIQ